MKGLAKGSIFLLAFMLLLGCQERSKSVNGPVTEDTPPKDEKIYITDRTGKSWEVTHAVREYGFRTNNFQYGLGPNAIRPLNNPEMISRGEPGYPSDNSSEAIIGVSVNGDARAYPIRRLISHEVVNDRVGGKDLAVVY